jgi:hypothetical protein
MSAREEAQQKLVEHLNEHSDFWTAPYGILDGMHDIKRGGKVRTITFGVARSLDATIFIWSPGNITIDGRGPLEYRVSGNFDSVGAVIGHLSPLYEEYVETVLTRGKEAT